MIISYHQRNTGGLVFLTSMLAIASGCGDDKPRFEILSIEATIEQVVSDANGTGSVTVSYFNDKRQMEVVATGLITRETEISINGAVANINDLRIGDRIRGEIRVGKNRGVQQLTAMKVYVDRATTSGG